MHKSLLTGLALIAATSAHAQNRDLNISTVNSSGNTSVTAEIWVDNWFAMYVDGVEILEDSTPYKTERSFNAERVTFNADLPMTVAFEFRDFMENDTGLEYIGTRRQQLGDGGAIAQFKVGGQTIGVTSSDWKCLLIHHAPVSTACEKESSPTTGQGNCAADITDAPANWTSADFDDSGWTAAVEHSESDVSPKMGYDEVSWDSAAQLIWTDSLKQDNIILCRATLG